MSMRQNNFLITVLKGFSTMETILTAASMC